MDIDSLVHETGKYINSICKLITVFFYTLLQSCFYQCIQFEKDGYIGKVVNFLGDVNHLGS